jgi:hypothetical protein
MTLSSKIRKYVIDTWYWLIQGSFNHLVIFYKGKGKDPAIKLCSSGLLGFPCAVAITKDDFERIKNVFDNLDNTQRLMEEIAEKDNK